MIFRLANVYDELLAAQRDQVILGALRLDHPEAFALFALLALAGALALVPWLLRHERRLRAAWDRGLVVGIAGGCEPPPGC